MKLVYWVATCLDDSACYNIRAKTKKEAQRLLNEQRNLYGGNYGEVQRHEVEYEDRFDLLDLALSEARAFEPRG